MPHSSQMKCVLWSDEAKFQLVFWKKTVSAKDELDHPDCYQAKVQNQHLSWSRGASVATAWLTCIYVKVPLTQRCTLGF